jgi:hypothetical protein
LGERILSRWSQKPIELISTRISFGRFGPGGIQATRVLVYANMAVTLYNFEVTVDGDARQFAEQFHTATEEYYIKASECYNQRKPIGWILEGRGPFFKGPDLPYHAPRWLKGW